MAVINLTSEEFANRIEEMLDLASKGDNEGYTLAHIEQTQKKLKEPAACSRTGISRIEARGSLYETHRGRNSQKGTDSF